MERLSKLPETTQASPEAVAHAVEALATEFHEDWRKTRLQEDGSFEPRIKQTKDENWIEAHDTDQIDIANTGYAELPSDWQVENKAAAEVVVGVMSEYNGQVDLSDPTVRTDVGSKVHDAWLSRNEWAKGGELDVPFDQLPDGEQAKDLDQIVVAQHVFSS